jgi:DNA-binding transcriptional ArsR family regulator
MEAKTDEFSVYLQEGAAAAKLLGHPARMAIIQYLAGQKACVTGDITAELPLSRGTVHQHLDALKEAGWIKGEIKGARVAYCLDVAKIHLEIKSLRAFLKDCEGLECSDC